MADMLFTNKEQYTKIIEELFKECDIFTLDKILNLILRHLYPGHFR